MNEDKIKTRKKANKDEIKEISSRQARLVKASRNVTEDMNLL